ncbi:MAG TPA: DUF4382 domain-containing protein [Flavisolibacter sp.]
MKTSLRFLGSAILVSILAMACNKNDKTVPVQFLLTDNPAVYDSVNVHITDMQVKINGDNEPWIDIDAKDTVVNLLDLQNGVTMVIAQDNIPDGVLKEVRFILGDGNYVVVNGTVYPMQTPSAEDSGLKIKIDKDLNETLNVFTLDFDAALSVKEENGSYKLMPVIKLK